MDNILDGIYFNKSSNRFDLRTDAINNENNITSAFMLFITFIIFIPCNSLKTFAFKALIILYL